MTYVSRAIKKAVRERARGRCEYCRTPEEYRPYSFQVEHVRAVKHGGPTELKNLAWACLSCNLRKGTDLVTIVDPNEQLVPLFNPRTQIWDEHFGLDGYVFVGKTTTGQATIQLLKLNHPDQIETRKILIDAELWD